MGQSGNFSENFIELLFFLYHLVTEGHVLVCPSGKRAQCDVQAPFS